MCTKGCMPKRPRSGETQQDREEWVTPREGSGNYAKGECCKIIYKGIANDCRPWWRSGSLLFYRLHTSFVNKVATKKRNDHINNDLANCSVRGKSLQIKHDVKEITPWGESKPKIDEIQHQWGQRSHKSTMAKVWIGEILVEWRWWDNLGPIKRRNLRYQRETAKNNPPIKP